MDKVKRALQPYAVAALAAVTLNARKRVQDAMWRSKRNVLLIGGAGIFLYGVGSATPGALVALLARDHEKHAGTADTDVSSEDTSQRQDKAGTFEAMKEGASRVAQGSKFVIAKAKDFWASADEWISEKEEVEGQPDTGNASAKPSWAATVWQRAKDAVNPPPPPPDHSILTDQSSDPFEGMDEAWNSEAAAEKERHENSAR